MGNDKKKLVAIPILIVVFAAVLYFQYGSKSQAVVQRNSAMNVAKSSMPEANVTGEKNAEVASNVPAEISLDAILNNNPFARGEPLRSLMELPGVAEMEPVAGAASNLVAVTVPQENLRLPPESLQALFGTSKGWTAIIKSTVVHIGDQISDDSDRVIGTVIAIDRNGVVIEVAPAVL